jgi:hypothetical protein
MKIQDQTPFRAADGKIDLVGRVRGTLKYGLSWYDRMQAQDTAISVMDKVLGEKYSLLRNVTIQDTDIELPLVLVGPQGIFLINVIHEKGVFRAKDDEWGTVSGEKFAPAAINQVQRTLKLARVLQVYLERAGLKNTLVDPVLMSADPGTHIESTRPAVRVIMSDALERFAISMTQGGAVLGFDVIARIVKIILGRKKEEPAAPVPAQAAAVDSAPKDAFSLAPDEPDREAFSYSFDDKLSAYQPGPPQDNRAQQGGSSSNDFFRDEDSQAEKVSPFDESLPTPLATEIAQAEAQAKPKPKRRAKAPAQKKGFLGLTGQQLAVLAAGLVVWLCIVIGFVLYLYLFQNG